jgi:hypothetical protein
MDPKKIRRIYDEHIECLEFMNKINNHQTADSLIIGKRTLLWEFLSKQGHSLLRQDATFAETVRRMVEEVLRSGIDSEIDQEDYGSSTDEHYAAKRLHDLVVSLYPQEVKGSKVQHLIESAENASYEYDHVHNRIQLWRHLTRNAGESRTAEQTAKIQNLLDYAKLSLKSSPFPAHAKEERVLLHHLSLQF